MTYGQPLLIGIYGPTASGKTALAERMASELDAQLINADAFQAYRFLDIGTAKPENKHLYALLDILDPKDSFGVGDWVLRAGNIVRPLFDIGRSAVIVGGTGLYMRALFEEYAEMGPPPSQQLRDELAERLETQGLSALIEELRQKDPDRAQRTDLANPARVRRALEKAYLGFESIKIDLPSFRKVKIGLLPETADLGCLIEQRTAKMMQNGWVDEVRGLLQKGYGPEDPAFRAIGYNEVAQYITKTINRDEASARIVTSTRQYAKRQKTWMRSEPRLNQLAGFGYDNAVFAKAMDCLVFRKSI